MSSQVLSQHLIVDETKNQFIIDKIISKPVINKIEKMMAQAFQCVEDENFSDALELYDLALKEDPNNIGILIDKGATLQNMGNLKLAIHSYDKALEISPQNIDALLNKGTILHSDEKYIQAIECYDSVLKIDKRSAMALAYKGLSLAELGEFDNAIKYFKKALSIDKHYDLPNISKDMALELKAIKESKIQ